MNSSIILSEVHYKAVKSSGPGGQHVNKTASKVAVYFSISSSKGLSEGEKIRLLHRLSSRLSSENILVLQCSETRSQHRNKTLVTKRLLQLLEDHRKPKKKRLKTKPSRSATEKRLREKKGRALKKSNRKPPEF